MKKIIITAFFTMNMIACGSPTPVKKELRPFSEHDKTLFNIGECSRSRRDFMVKSCLKKYYGHVFQGKLMVINTATTGVEAIVDIGQTEVTCHIHPTTQTWKMLKSLVVGDIVAVNGAPEELHNLYSYNNLILSQCTLLPVKRYADIIKEKQQPNSP